MRLAGLPDCWTEILTKIIKLISRTFFRDSEKVKHCQTGNPAANINIVTSRGAVLTAHNNPGRLLSVSRGACPHPGGKLDTQWRGNLPRSSESPKTDSRKNMELYLDEQCLFCLLFLGWREEMCAQIYHGVSERRVQNKW